MTDPAPNDVDGTTGAPRGERPAPGRPRDPALDEAIITATRRRLVLDGYSKMTLGDIAADAGVSRPTLYRRWPGKLALVVDALDWGLRAQLQAYPTDDLSDREPFEAFLEAVRRVDPRYANPDAIVLQANFMGEVTRVPELLDILRERAVEPRMAALRAVILDLQQRGAVRAEVDVETVVTMCFGSYFGAFLRHGEDDVELADKVATELWRGLAVTA